MLYIFDKLDIFSGSVEADHVPSYFLKDVFHKFYLVHSLNTLPYLERGP